MPNIYQQGKNKIPLVCQGCGITIYIPPKNAKKRKYCTLKCFYNHHDYTGENNPMYGRGYLTAGEKNGMFGKKESEEHKEKNRQANLGEKNARFINGHIKRGNRWYVWNGTKRIRRSRYVASQQLNRKLLSAETIHHINENCTDDRPENLYIFATKGEHIGFHNFKTPPILISNLTHYKDDKKS